MAPCRVARRVRRPVGMRDCGPWPPAGSLRLRASHCSSRLGGGARRAARRSNRVARRPRDAGARRRRHGARERAGAVSALQPRQGRAAGVIAPAALAGRRSSRGTRRTTRPDFLLVATPGAGKTLAACHAIRAADCEQVVVVCPTTALRAQWADAADRVGLHLDPRWRNADGAWRADVDGVVVTYQQVASAPDLFAHHLARPTFVVLDEIHHAGESATWGTALRAAFDGARAAPRAVRHAVPLGRARDPVRALRRRAPLRARLRLRLRRGGRRRGLPPARVPAARRHAALAGGCAGDDRRVRRRARPRPTTRAGCAPRSTRRRRCCRRCCATPTRCW